ncbi:hypothetical protein ACWCZ5_10500, partial [Streptomyces sp. NPDC001667]
MQSFKKADHEIMRWRVRLYCGHIIETEAHYTYTDPLSAGSYGRRCSECGEDRCGRRLKKWLCLTFRARATEGHRIHDHERPWLTRSSKTC